MSDCSCLRSRTKRRQCFCKIWHPSFELQTHMLMCCLLIPTLGTSRYKHQFEETISLCIGFLIGSLSHRIIQLGVMRMVTMRLLSTNQRLKPILMLLLVVCDLHTTVGCIPNSSSRITIALGVTVALVIVFDIIIGRYGGVGSNDPQ